MRSVIIAIGKALRRARARARHDGAEADALARLNRLSSRLWRMRSLGEGLDEVLAATTELLGADMGHVQILDPRRGALAVAAQRGFDPDLVDSLREAAATDDSAGGRALTSGERIVVPDVEADPAHAPLRTVARAAGYRAVQSTPLIGRDGKPLGTLSTHFRRVHRPSEPDLRWLDLYARQAADFIERCTTDEALREGAQRLRLALEAGRMGTWEWSLETGRVVWSQSLEAIHGLEPGSFGGSFEAYQKDIHPDDREKVNASIARALERGDEHHVEYRIIWPDGSIRWLEASGAVVEHRDGAPVGMVGVCADITDRKTAERARQESEERFVRFMQHLPGLAWIKDLQGRYVFANDAALKAFRAPRDRLYGRTDEEVFPPEVAAQFAENDRRALAAATGVQFVELLEHEDGVLHHSIVSKFPVLGPDDEPAWVGGMAIDVTEHRRAEDALRDSEARLRAVFDTAVDGIITISEGGIIESVNPAVERLFGYPTRELIGRNVSVLMPEPYHSEHDSYLESYRRTGERKIIGIGREVVGLRRDGTRFPMDLAVSELTLGGERMFTGLVRDITERKRAEEGLREADRRKTEFLATLAHELRNPLAPIRNSLEILGRAAADPDVLRRARETIERQVSHMVRLVDDLLDVSRITRDKLELRRTRVELASVVHQAVETCRPLAEMGDLAVELALPGPPVFLDADPVRLAQVFSNLLNNACKYTGRGGTIRVGAERRGADVVVSVTDSGVGISPDKLESIFEMFTQLETTLERSRSGLGIGLTLAKRLVDLHGGSIEARSPGLGQGSEFVVRLPALAERADSQAPAAPVAIGPDPTPLRVLVVDDNEDSAVSLARLLCLGGHETRTVHDGLATVEAAEQFRPDVVLLDIGLPKLSGLDACRRIREQAWGREMVVVALTGWGQDDDRERSRYAGFDAHVVKPVGHDTLVRLLGDLRDRRGHQRRAGT